MRNKQLGNTKVFIHESREEMGRNAADYVEKAINDVLKEKGTCSMILASAPSQLDMLNALMERDIDWTKFTLFHMDEYVGFNETDEVSFGRYIKDHFVDKINGKMFYLNGRANDVDAEMERYTKLLQEHGVDISLMGIGENGHLAFNDPGIADFFDPKNVKVNDQLDEICIGQQVKDGWFESAEAVPNAALTLTMPILLRAKYIFTCVPGATKAEIIGRLFREEISTKLPGSIIRLHERSILFLDEASAARIDS